MTYASYISKGLGSLVTVLSIGWAADIGRYGGLAIWNEQFYGAVLGIVLALIYVQVPASGKGPRAQPPWYDAAASILSLVATGYLVYYYREFSENIAYMPMAAIVAGAIVILLVMEGIRRTCGVTLLAIVALFFVYAMLGHHLPGNLAARQTDIDRLLLYLSLDTNGLLGLPLGVIATIVLAFVFFGNVLQASGGGEFFTDIAATTLGRYRGGSAKISIIASALFGSVSGSTVANVVSTGVITIPLMKRGGYKPHQAAAIEAVASTGGQLMPPIMGAAAFLMAEFLQVSYGEIIIAALCPALLYYAAIFIQADLMASRDGIRSVSDFGQPSIGQVLLGGGHFVMPFAAILYCLFVLNLSPEMSALTGAVLVIASGAAFGYRGKRLTFSALFEAVVETGTTMTQIVMVGAAAGLIIGILNVSGFGFALTLGLVKLGAGSFPLMLVIAAGASILLGLGMPTVGVYVLLAVLISPAMAEVGVEPIAAHMFVLYFGMMSMITPPVAIGAFAAATIARSNPWSTGFSAMAFAWPAYVIPFLFVASPTYLLIGSPMGILFDLATAVAGIWLISAGIIGHLLQPLNLPARGAFVVIGGLLMAPFHGTQWGLIASAFAGVSALVIIYVLFRRSRPPANSPMEASGAR